MIQFIELHDFQDCVKCTALTYTVKESFIKISYKFHAGNVYGLSGDFGCGGWAIASCLGGRCSDNYDGCLIVDGKLVHKEELIARSCFVGEVAGLKTPREQIKEALGENGAYSYEEIQRIFKLSDSRLDRSMEFVSGERWLISLALGFAGGKDIYCFPWLNMVDIDIFRGMYLAGIIDFLKRNGKIILVPSSQKRVLKRMCDHLIIIRRSGYKMK